MTEHELLERAESIQTWKQGGVRAPHKPLLLLLGLSRVQHDQPRLVSFQQVEDE